MEPSEFYERLEAITNQLIASGMDYVLRHYDAPRVARADLERVHDAAYLDRVYAMAPGPGGTPVEIDGDADVARGRLLLRRRGRRALFGLCSFGPDAGFRGDIRQVDLVQGGFGVQVRRRRACERAQLSDDVAVVAVGLFAGFFQRRQNSFDSVDRDQDRRDRGFVG